MYELFGKIIKLNCPVIPVDEKLNKTNKIQCTVCQMKKEGRILHIFYSPNCSRKTAEKTLRLKILFQFMFKKKIYAQELIFILKLHRTLKFVILTPQFDIFVFGTLLQDSKQEVTWSSTTLGTFGILYQQSDSQEKGVTHVT